jgi:long-chain acyl-CoA synthetase
LQLTNSPELVLAYYACFQIGAVSVPLNARFAAPEIAYALNHSASRVCISQSDLFGNIAPLRSNLKALEHVFLIDKADSFSGTRAFGELLDSPALDQTFPQVPDDAVAAILYTSGTTSRPKGVTHTHRSLCATAESHGSHIGMRSDDVVCVVSPMCHILGFALQMLTGIWGGAALVIIPRSDPELVLNAVQDHQATRIGGLPTMYQSLTNHPGAERYSLKTLRTCLCGGDAVPMALQERFRSTFGVAILEGCGMTEVVPYMLNTTQLNRSGSIGCACPGVTIRLVDDSGRDVPVGSVGEILVKSDSTMIGYWKEPEISESVMAGGFIRSGDLGRVDEDGFYWFTGRKKEIIIRAGSNISPLEVEDVMYQHPGVRECGVVGVPDADLGEVVWAYVAVRHPVTATDLQEFARHKIAPYKVPEAIRFLPDLPKGPTGKVHRRTLRDQATWERSGAFLKN